MKVINFFGGPGTGKSTTAAGLFFLMKQAHKKVELVTEYAKDLTYEDADLSNQLALFCEQERRLRRLQSHVDFAITDSPLILSRIYAPREFQGPAFEGLVYHFAESYDNFNVFLGRIKPYAEYGRKQTEEEARAIDAKIHGIYHKWDLQVPADAVAPHVVFKALFG